MILEDWSDALHAPIPLFDKRQNSINYVNEAKPILFLAPHGPELPSLVSASQNQIAFRASVISQLQCYSQTASTLKIQYNIDDE